MSSEPELSEHARKVAETLRGKIRARGLTEAQVAERAGIGESELREILAGTPGLLVKQLYAILAAIGVPPLEFFLDLYGSPRDPLDDIKPTYETLRRLILQLERKGVFTREQSDRLIEKLPSLHTLTRKSGVSRLPT